MKQRIYLSIIIILSIFIASCTTGNTVKKDISKLGPKEVVSSYYNAFANKDYETMYALISDGFKKIEPTAKDFNTFKAYISKYYNTASYIKLIDVSEESNDGETVLISYKVELGLNAGKKDLESSFTVKKKVNGWKLVHPYGENIDTS